MVDTPWSLEQADDLYRVSAWGAGYFAINKDGNVVVNVPHSDGVSVPLIDIIEGVRERGKEAPILLRIPNLLESQISQINDSFREAIAGAHYQGAYRGVFPIKVNQQAQVIADVVRYGKKYQHGLEAGSKAELMIALAMLPEPGPLIVCNGYKDSEFVELGLGMMKLGYEIVFVIETPAEVPIIIEASKKIGVRPIIGVRTKLFSKVSGHWNDTSGDRSMFGLNAKQLVDVIDNLKAAGMMDCLQFLHYHLGSQIPNIRDIRTGVREACRYYIELIDEGAPMQFLDLGGGLAVDYDGTRSSALQSRNYSLQEYCVDVVETIQAVLDERSIKHPTIVTESGRATSAYSSVLVFDILDVTGFSDATLPENLVDEENPFIQNLIYTYKNLSPKTAQECFNDAVYFRDEARVAFMNGHIQLRVRAEVDRYFMVIMSALQKMVRENPDIISDAEVLKTMLSDIYYGNFSVFQSLPDAWAIDQIFPITPLHRLNEMPTHNSILADMTCDSDGKLDRFAEQGEIQRVLPLHTVNPNEPYYLGVFLVGAYQETLGDLHNLLGDTHVVSVHINQDGSYDYVEEVEGDTVADVLSYVEYQPQNLLANFRATAERAVRQGKISPSERQQLVDAYSVGLRGYTYYEK